MRVLGCGGAAPALAHSAKCGSVELTRATAHNLVLTYLWSITMRSRSLLSLLALAGTATTLLAAPRESVTFNSVPSNGLANNDTLNTILTHTFAGADAGGPYAATHLRISGTATENAALSATNLGHMAILITPPSGTPFIARPFGGVTTVTSTVTDAIVIPVSALSTAGTWTFRFFEMFDDGTAATLATVPDSTWLDVTITLDDGPAPTGVVSGGGPSVTLSNVDVDGIATAGAVDTPITFPSGTNVVAARISGVGTFRTASTTGSGSSTGASNRARIQLVYGGGAFTSPAVTPNLSTANSSETFNALIALPSAVDSEGGGGWSLRTYNSSTANDFAGVDMTFPSLNVTLLPAQPTPTGTVIPFTNDGEWTTVAGNLAAPNTVLWYTLTITDEVNSALFRALDIDTEGSALSPVNDTGLVMYTSTGAVQATDNDDGSGSLSQLTFGRGTRPADVTGSLTYSGRDGVLAPGTYYIALTGGGISGVTGYNIVGGPNTGSTAIRARYFPVFGTAPTTAGSLAISDGNWVSLNSTLAAGEVKWFLISGLPAITTTAPANALDIDTQGSNLTPANDTAIALYNSTGALQDSDNNDGVGLLSALSYGSTATATSRPFTQSGVRWNGRDGTLIAGDYYLAVIGADAVTTAPATFQSTAFQVTPPAAANTGPLTVRVRYATTFAAETPAAIATTIPVTPLTAPDATWTTLNTTMTATDIKWFTFTTPAALDVTGGVDIDLEGTNLGPTNDPDMAVYNSGGTLVDSDEDDGSGTLPQLSWGTGRRNPPGDGLPFIGADGPIVLTPTTTTMSPGQQYFLAVSGSDTTTHGSTFNSQPGTSPVITGPLTVRFRMWNSNAALDPIAPPPATNIPALVDGGAWSSVTEAIAGGEVKWFKLTAPAIVAANNNALDIDTSLSTVTDTGIALYRVNGTVEDSDVGDGPGLLAQLSYGRGSRPPIADGLAFSGADGDLLAGEYWLAVASGTLTTAVDFGPTTSSTLSGDVTIRARYWSNFAQTPPTVIENLGTLPVNTVVTRTAPIGASGVAWYQFTTDRFISRFKNVGLSLDTEGSVTDPVNDTALGLYRADGTLSDSDTADGSGSLGTITLGADSRPAPGDGLTYNGRDAWLAPGTYYVAVALGAPTFSTGFGPGNLPAANTANPAQLNIQLVSPGIPLSPPVTPPGTIDLGVIGTTTPGVPAVITRTFTVTDNQQFQWFRFEATQPMDNTTGFYMDIDTEGTAPDDPTGTGPAALTEIQMFGEQGLFVATDTVSGSGSRSLFTYGATTPERPVIITGTSSAPIARNGSDGFLPAGVYYAAVGLSGIVAPTSDSTTQFTLGVPTAAPTAVTSTINFNIRTNLPGGPSCSSRANVAGPNQSTTPDATLTADDIIVFLGWYFGATTGSPVAGNPPSPANLLADVSGANQNSSAPDGALTADDIIVFIGFYFAGCP
jgi:hypothetical protein